jgi:hypothetical protein
VHNSKLKMPHREFSDSQKPTTVLCGRAVAVTPVASSRLFNVQLGAANRPYLRLNPDRRLPNWPLAPVCQRRANLVHG